MDNSILKKLQSIKKWLGEISLLDNFDHHIKGNLNQLMILFNSEQMELTNERLEEILNKIKPNIDVEKVNNTKFNTGISKPMEIHDMDFEEIFRSYANYVENNRSSEIDLDNDNTNYVEIIDKLNENIQKHNDIIIQFDGFYDKLQKKYVELLKDTETVYENEDIAWVNNIDLDINTQNYIPGELIQKNREKDEHINKLLEDLRNYDNIMEAHTEFKNTHLARLKPEVLGRYNELKKRIIEIVHYIESEADELDKNNEKKKNYEILLRALEENNNEMTKIREAICVNFNQIVSDRALNVEYLKFILERLVPLIKWSEIPPTKGIKNNVQELDCNNLFEIFNKKPKISLRIPSLAGRKTQDLAYKDEIYDQIYNTPRIGKPNPYNEKIQGEIIYAIGYETLKDFMRKKENDKRILDEQRSKLFEQNKGNDIDEINATILESERKIDEYTSQTTAIEGEINALQANDDFLNILSNKKKIKEEEKFIKKYQNIDRIMLINKLEKKIATSREQNHRESITIEINKLDAIEKAIMDMHKKGLFITNDLKKLLPDNDPVIIFDKSKFNKQAGGTLEESIQKATNDNNYKIEINKKLLELSILSDKLKSKMFQTYTGINSLFNLKKKHILYYIYILFIEYASEDMTPYSLTRYINFYEIKELKKNIIIISNIIKSNSNPLRKYYKDYHQLTVEKMLNLIDLIEHNKQGDYIDVFGSLASSDLKILCHFGRKLSKINI